MNHNIIHFLRDLKSPVLNSSMSLVDSETYEVHFVQGNVYYTHCFHEVYSYYNENSSFPFKTERDYYQSVGG